MTAIYTHLGDVCKMNEDWENAKYYYEKSLDLKRFHYGNQNLSGKLDVNKI